MGCLSGHYGEVSGSNCNQSAGEADWRKMGYSSNFTSPMLKGFSSLHAYLEQGGMHLSAWT